MKMAYIYLTMTLKLRTLPKANIESQSRSED